MPARVLIVGGDFPRARSIERTLADAAFDVAIATTPLDCIALCQALWPSIVLLDAADPASNALDLCRTLKNGHGLHQPGVVVLSEGDQPVQRLLALDAGADECLSSPFDPPTLLARLRSLAQWTNHADDLRRLMSVRGLAAQDNLATASPRSRVLVLDPEERSRLRLSEILEREFEVIATPDTTEVFARTAEGGYDVALIGLDWPDVVGSKFYQRLRILEQGRQLRLLLVTNCDSRRLPSLMEHGIDDFIPRPVDRNETLGRVRLATRKQKVTAALRSLDPSRAEGAPFRFASRLRPYRPDRFAA